MPRNSSGKFTLPAGNPVIPDTVIESVWANTTLEDVALALTQSLARSGVGGMLGQLKVIDGIEGEPGIGFLGELDTGFYLEAPGELRMTLSGQDLFRWYDGAVWVWRASTSTWERVVASNSISVDDLGNVTINGNLIVTGDTNIGGNLTVDGDTVLGGATTIDNLIVNGTTTISNDPVSANRPYRYWRMDMMDSADSINASLSEIELVIGELPVQTLASILPGAGISNRFRLNDGQTNLSSAISINGSPSIVWDFGAATPQPLTYIRQFPGPLIGGLTAFRISASDDGINWAILNGFSGLSPVLEEWSEPYYIFPQGVEEAPIDGTPYSRQDAGWVPAGGGGGGPYTVDPVEKTSDFNAESGKVYLVDSFSDWVAMTMPSSPAIGDVIGFVQSNRNDSGGDPYGVAVNFNNKKYMAGSYGTSLQSFSNERSDPQYVSSVLYVYTGEDMGWVVSAFGVWLPPPLV